MNLTTAPVLNWEIYAVIKAGIAARMRKKREKTISIRTKGLFFQIVCDVISFKIPDSPLYIKLLANFYLRLIWFHQKGKSPWRPVETGASTLNRQQGKSDSLSRQVCNTCENIIFSRMMAANSFVCHRQIWISYLPFLKADKRGSSIISGSLRIEITKEKE